MVCKTIIGGSIPPRASNFLLSMSGQFGSKIRWELLRAGVSLSPETNQNYSANFIGGTAHTVRALLQILEMSESEW